jgi:hypothetical protein
MSSRHILILNHDTPPLTERDYKDEHNKSASQSQRVLPSAKWMIHASGLALAIIWKQLLHFFTKYLLFW